MSEGPTNTQIGIAPLEDDTETVVREMCAAQGCTCGDGLKVIVETLSREEAAELEARGLPSGAKHSNVSVSHRLGCPLLTAQMGRN